LRIVRIARDADIIAARIKYLHHLKRSHMNEYGTGGRLGGCSRR
jgi:hypothetical protein